MTIYLVIVLWLAIGFIDYGLITAYYTYKFPAFKIMPGLIVMALLGGPFALLSSFLTGQVHGFRLKPYTKEQRWEAHQRLWPALSDTLSIEDFE